MWIIIILIFILATFTIICYNTIVQLKVQTEEAFSTMDVYLKKRFDVLPNLTTVVKAYAQHEAQTLENVTNIRAAAISLNEKVNAEEKIDNALYNVRAISEAYPDLKANENFLMLQKQLTEIEGEVAKSRKYYNAVVREYNINISQFPSIIIAKLFHFQKISMFAATQSEKENVKINM